MSFADVFGDGAADILAAFKADPDFGFEGLLADATTAAGNVQDVSTLLAEIEKIPRSATALTAGQVSRRSKVAATSATLDETIGPTP